MSQKDGVINPWTDLDNVIRVGVYFLNGDHCEFNVDAIVRNSYNQPLWLTYRDSNELEVIVPWVAIRSLSVLERKERQ